MLQRHRKDHLMEFFREMLNHSFVLDVSTATCPDTFAHFEELIEEHRQKSRQGKGSRLKTLVPTVGTFFTPLPLQQAFKEYDNKFCLTARRFVPISFDDVRHILNLAQVKASSGTLELVTFDGDQTLYQDGKDFEDPALAAAIISLLRVKVRVALVTAAGYNYEGPKYEKRLKGLIDEMKKVDPPLPDIPFYVLGGECNYLLKMNANFRLEKFVDDWNPLQSEGYGQYLKDVPTLLDTAEESLRDSVEQLKMRAVILRKDRAVGIISGGEKSKSKPGHGSTLLRRESLDEACLRVLDALRQKDLDLPYCAFNGGQDVWVDVGNKRVGVQGLQRKFAINPEACLHIGDQMWETGNDFAARSCCPTVWIANPRETHSILKSILKERLGVRNGQQGKDYGRHEGNDTEAKAGGGGLSMSAGVAGAGDRKSVV